MIESPAHRFGDDLGPCGRDRVAAAEILAVDEHAVTHEILAIDRRKPRHRRRIAEPRPRDVEHRQPLRELAGHPATDLSADRVDCLRQVELVHGEQRQVHVADRRREPTVGQAADRERR